MDKTKIVVLVVVMLLLSSSIGVVAWGASTNWWSPDESSTPSGTPQAPSPGVSPQVPKAPSPGVSPQAPAPATVTLNNQTFDPSGYLVSKGMFWAREPAAPSGYSSTIDECRQRCINTPSCNQFARSENSGTCYVNKDVKYIDDHVRGMKPDGTKPYTKPGHIQWYWDSASSNTRMDIQTCISNCTSNNSCTAWYYRTSSVSDPALQRTCVLHNSNTNAEQYKEGVF